MPFIDRSQMRSPFYTVRIGPPGARNDNDFVTLPQSVVKLIHSFEYSEAIDGGRNSASRIKLVFLEDLNKPGSVLDLKFNDEGKVSFLDPTIVKNGVKQQQEISKLETAIGKSLTDTIVDPSDNKSTLTKKNAEKRLIDLQKQQRANATQFLLQERNTIEVTWGYRETNDKRVVRPLSPRVVRGEILQITHNASSSGIPITEVMAVDVGSAEMSKIYPSEAINFSRKKVKQLLNGKLNDPTNRSDVEPARIDDIFTAVAHKVLKNTVVRIKGKSTINLTPEELNFDIQDATSSRNWTMGRNLHDFLKDLAEKLHAHYYTTLEVDESKKLVTVLNLVSRRIHEGESKFHFMWKSGMGASGLSKGEDGGLVFNTMTNYSMALYPSGGNGGSSSGVCSNRKQLVGHVADIDIVFSARHSELKEIDINKAKSKSIVSQDPDNSERNKSVAVPTYSATCSDSDHEASANRLAGRMEKNLKLNFSTIGIPQLTPQVVKVSNIGERYSGLYYLLSVTHKITSDGGYVCSVVGESNAVSSGGVSVEGPPVRNDLAAEDIRLKFRSDNGFLENILDTAEPVTSGE